MLIVPADLLVSFQCPSTEKISVLPILSGVVLSKEQLVVLHIMLLKTIVKEEIGHILVLKEGLSPPGPLAPYPWLVLTCVNEEKVTVAGCSTGSKGVLAAKSR